MGGQDTTSYMSWAGKTGGRDTTSYMSWAGKTGGAVWDNGIGSAVK